MGILVFLNMESEIRAINSDTVQRLIDPVGVELYTTISREHSQVAGVKNPFEEYVDAKSLLSQGMTRGVVISNADDPVTANIACNKRNDLHVNFYGLYSSINDIFESDSPNCPRCGKSLNTLKILESQRNLVAAAVLNAMNLMLNWLVLTLSLIIGI